MCVKWPSMQWFSGTRIPFSFLPLTSPQPLLFVPFCVIQPTFKSFLGLWARNWAKLQSKCKGVLVRGTLRATPTLFSPPPHSFPGVARLGPLPLTQKQRALMFSKLPCCCWLLPWQPEPTDNPWERTSEEEPAWYPLMFSSNTQSIYYVSVLSSHLAEMEAG